MRTELITLDHPIEINGISVRVIPVRAPNYLDHNEATRLSLRKHDGDKLALVKALAPHVAKEDMAQAVYGFAMMRCISGLPFDALFRLETVDHQKFSDFIVDSRRSVED